MKTITLKSPDGKAKFTIGAYKAGETFEAFKGATGIFGAKAGSKTAGLIYVVENCGTVHASDMDVDNETQWAWIAEWMQKGMASESLLTALQTIANQCGSFATKEPALDYATIANVAREAIAKATQPVSY